MTILLRYTFLCAHLPSISSKKLKKQENGAAKGEITNCRLRPTFPATFANDGLLTAPTSDFWSDRFWSTHGRSIGGSDEDVADERRDDAASRNELTRTEAHGVRFKRESRVSRL